MYQRQFQRIEVSSFITIASLKENSFKRSVCFFFTKMQENLMARAPNYGNDKSHNDVLEMKCGQIL